MHQVSTLGRAVAVVHDTMLGSYVPPWLLCKVPAHNEVWRSTQLSSKAPAEALQSLRVLVDCKRLLKKSHSAAACS